MWYADKNSGSVQSMEMFVWNLKFSRVRRFFICQTCKIVHARVEGKGYFFALLKRVITFAIFNFGIVALVDTGQMLHFNLGESFF